MHRQRCHVDCSCTVSCRHFARGMSFMNTSSLDHYLRNLSMIKVKNNSSKPVYEPCPLHFPFFIQSVVFYKAVTVINTCCIIHGRDPPLVSSLLFCTPHKIKSILTHLNQCCHRCNRIQPAQMRAWGGLIANSFQLPYHIAALPFNSFKPALDNYV